MVKLTEVEDEHFTQDQAGPANSKRETDNNNDDDDSFTDTDSSLSADESSPHAAGGNSHKQPSRHRRRPSTISSSDSDSDSDEVPETLTDRIYALRDMIPPRQRAVLTNTVSKTSTWMRTGMKVGGKTLWVVSTSALLVLVPWTLACMEEAQFVEMERESRVQRSANEVLAPGASGL